MPGSQRGRGRSTSSRSLGGGAREVTASIGGRGRRAGGSAAAAAAAAAAAEAAENIVVLPPRAATPSVLRLAAELAPPSPRPHSQATLRGDILTLPLELPGLSPSAGTETPPVAATAEAAEAAGDVAWRAPQQLQRKLAPRGRGKTFYVRCSEALLAGTYLAVVSISIAMLYYLFSDDSVLMHTQVFSIAGVFVALTLPLSAHDIHMHMTHYVSPLQKFYLRILFMVPIYSVQSWLALRFKEEKFIFATLRETYEAYTLYTFYMLMLEFLGGRRKLAQRLAAKPKERAAHLPPFCCLRGWRLGSRFVHRCTLGVYQYVFLRVICSILMVLTESLHLYKEGNWNPRYFYVWSTVIINVSQCWALYMLALFYVETHEDLKPLGPLGKFAVVKVRVCG